MLELSRARGAAPKTFSFDRTTSSSVMATIHLISNKSYVCKLFFCDFCFRHVHALLNSPNSHYCQQHC